MCQGAFSEIIKNISILNLGLKSYFPNEHIIVENIRRQCFQLAQSSWKLVSIIIIYHIFIYHSLLFIDLCFILLIFRIDVQVRFSESTILTRAWTAALQKMSTSN